MKYKLRFTFVILVSLGMVGSLVQACFDVFNLEVMNLRGNITHLAIISEGTKDMRRVTHFYIIFDTNDAIIANKGGNGVLNDILDDGYYLDIEFYKSKANPNWTLGTIEVLEEKGKTVPHIEEIVFDKHTTFEKFIEMIV